MRVSARTIGLVSGILAAGIFVGLYVIAMSIDSRYVFGENYLSDLGVGDGAWAFNSGVIIAGALFVPFVVLGIRSTLAKSFVGEVSTALLVIAGLFLISIGIFTENAGDIHGVVSYGFFLTTLVALAFLSYSFDKSGPGGRKRAIVTLVAFVLGVGLLPLGGTPLVETIAVLAIITWGLMVSLMIMLKK